VEALLGGLAAAAVAALVALGTSWWDRRQRDKLLSRELEHQARAALRKSYAALLVTQRRSRELSRQLAEAGGATTINSKLAEAARAAHDEFIDSYHQLNLDSSPPMWLEVRGLRHVLDEMLEFADKGRVEDFRKSVDVARDARQNLERSFRERLGYAPLQPRRNLGRYDKVDPLL
jgi:hypothetical protein